MTLMTPNGPKMAKNDQGWAGIPVPGHSQEWRPLIPVPELWEWIFSFPSRSRISGMSFFIPFPFPNFGNGFFHSLPVPKLWEWKFSFPSRSRIDHFIEMISKSGIKRENGRLWEMLVFQHFQLPLHFILHKNGGSKVKVAYCCLVIYELNSMSVSDYHPICDRQFLATKMKVKWKFDMDIGQHGGLPSFF